MATPCVVHHSAELRMGRDIAQRTKSSDAQLDDDPSYNVTESSNSPTFRSGSPSLPALDGICLHTAEVHKAASSQDVSHLRSLLTSENVNQRLCSGTTPLFLVIASCETNPEPQSSRVLDLVRFLLELKADVNAESEAWPRKFLTYHSHSEGSQPIPSTGVAELRWTPLMKAASLGEIAVVQLLLENGANSTSVRHDGATAYSLAVQSGHKDTASVFPLLGTLHERKEKGKKHFKAFRKQVRGVLDGKPSNTLRDLTLKPGDSDW
ncbi:hypothetical protein DL96DRAFT_1598558 [Flagelloscypha sp. PMI_526]|nr:hypothetical protein DL96DRAFT_1598558 [Flagelloscypha sp. PMI_526]